MLELLGTLEIENIKQMMRTSKSVDVYQYIL